MDLSTAADAYILAHRLSIRGLSRSFCTGEPQRAALKEGRLRRLWRMEHIIPLTSVAFSNMRYDSYDIYHDSSQHIYGSGLNGNANPAHDQLAAYSNAPQPRWRSRPALARCSGLVTLARVDHPSNRAFGIGALFFQKVCVSKVPPHISFSLNGAGIGFAWPGAAVHHPTLVCITRTAPPRPMTAPFPSRVSRVPAFV